MNRQSREKGQVLVLIILAIVGMLGFAALAIDLGRVFAERRRAQNAADSAVLAAANNWATSKTESSAQGAAVGQLGLNDYTDTALNVDNGQKIELEVHCPPTSGRYSGAPGYCQVLIHEQVDKVLAQFIFPGLMKFTVEAVANTDTAGGMFQGNALVATSPTDCKALWFSGSGQNGFTAIYGGDAYSLSGAGGTGSSCTPGGGSPSCASGVQGGNAAVYFDPGHTIHTFGPFYQHGSGGVYYNGTTNPVTIDDCNASVAPVPSLPPPLCDLYPLDPPTTTDAQGVIQYYPGRYTNGIRLTGQTSAHLNSGLYCLSGDLTVNLQTKVGDPTKGNLTGDQIMIYMANGSVKTTGGVINLQAILDSLKATPPFGAVGDPNYQWGGMLIYMDPSNTGQIQMGGNGSSQYSGTIFAPGPSAHGDKCVLDGTNGSVGFASSLICYTITTTGSNQLTINYNANTNFHFPPNLNMKQ